MTTDRYDIFFRGEALPAQDLAEVKAKVGRLFNADEAKLAQLFSGKACPIKKSVDKATAVKYQQAFKNAGAKALIIPCKQSAPVSSAVPETPASKATAAPTPSPASKQAAVNAGSWDILPSGSDLLKPSERKEVTPVTVDTSAIKLASVFAEPEQAPPPPPCSRYQPYRVGCAGL